MLPNVHVEPQQDPDPQPQALPNAEPPQPDEQPKTAFEKKQEAFDTDFDLLFARSSENNNYHLVHATFLQNLCKIVRCPLENCNHIGLHLREVTGTEIQRDGLNHKFLLSCPGCGETIDSLSTSPLAGTSKAPDVNARMILAMRTVGVGHAGMQEVCRVLGLPGVAKRTYQSHTKKIGDKAENVANENLRAAARKVHDEYDRTCPDQRGKAVKDIAVTYDGTWQKRGHSSHNGVGVVIDLHTGLVLDYEVLSNFCSACAQAKARFGDDGDGFNVWYADHRPVCEQNHDGSANSMESEAALKIFRRSEQKYGLRYTTVLSDGDTKRVNNLNSAKVYGENTQIIKEECVNHIAKRMFGRLDRFAGRMKAAGRPIGGRGKGKITKARMKKMVGIL